MTAAIELKIIDRRIGRDFAAPDFAGEGAAGIDLRACEERVLFPQTVEKVKTGVAIFLRDASFFGMLVARSGLGARGVCLANGIGVIDSDYQGEIFAALVNNGNAPQTIAAGERICQLLIVPLARPRIQIVDSFSTTTARGEGGFGSTGRF